MTQENKDLLLKDLCARLPYGVKVDIQDLFFSTKTNVEVLNEIFCGDDGEFRCNDSGILIKHVKPYLFPLSSMTEEQKSYLYSHTNFRVDIFGDIIVKEDEFDNYFYTDTDDYSSLIDWLNKNHFDYRGLIEEGLAIDATGLNIY